MPTHYPFVQRRGRGIWGVKTGPNTWMARTFFSQEDAQDELDRAAAFQEGTFPVVGEPTPPTVRIPGITSRPAPSGEILGPPVSLATASESEGTDPFSFLTVDQLREIIFSTESSPEEVRRASAILAAGGGVPDDGGGGGTGRVGPTAAELAIQRSQVQAQNLATFISGTIAELEIEVDARRLSTEQALGEFNRRLDAFSEAGSQFQGIQPFTITPGSEFLPGRAPGGIGERIGRPTLRADPINFDPFAMANQIVADTPVLTDIGVPSGNALDEAIEIARGFLGG